MCCCALLTGSAERRSTPIFALRQLHACAACLAGPRGARSLQHPAGLARPSLLPCPRCATYPRHCRAFIALHVCRIRAPPSTHLALAARRSTRTAPPPDSSRTHRSLRALDRGDKVRWEMKLNGVIGSDGTGLVVSGRLGALVRFNWLVLGSVV
jgi:hypothetical protein